MAGEFRSSSRPYDAGICVANVMLAMEALGLEGHWMMYEGTESDISDHPSNLRPVATLVTRTSPRVPADTERLQARRSGAPCFGWMPAVVDTAWPYSTSRTQWR